MAIDKAIRKLMAQNEILARKAGIDVAGEEWTNAGGFVLDGAWATETKLPKDAVSATIETVQTVVADEEPANRSAPRRSANQTRK